MLNGISVIVPAFNAGKTLAETLHSITGQTHPAAEIIVVDDGSTDDTGRLAAQVQGVRLIRQPNAGTAAALNAGLAVAAHPLIALLDADDVWPADCLARHAANLDREPLLDASVGWVSEFVCPSLPPATAARFRPRPDQVGWLSGATLVRSEAFARVGPFDPAAKGWPWIDWMDRARREGLRFGVMEQIVLRRRLHPGSLSTSAATQGGRGMIGAIRLALARRRPPGP